MVKFLSSRLGLLAIIVTAIIMAAGISSTAFAQRSHDRGYQQGHPGGGDRDRVDHRRPGNNNKGKGKVNHRRPGNNNKGKGKVNHRRSKKNNNNHRNNNRHDNDRNDRRDRDRR
ncbi:MAG: hypothetical protein LBQ79_15080 [Deltaproteobacteria bacterium]|jgi:hypothetical protein|nr:hypothetical protein [Deltaproteobacteria bacterium]